MRPEPPLERRWTTRPNPAMHPIGCGKWGPRRGCSAGPCRCTNKWAATAMIWGFKRTATSPNKRLKGPRAMRPVRCWTIPRNRGTHHGGCVKWGPTKACKEVCTTKEGVGKPRLTKSCSVVRRGAPMEFHCPTMHKATMLPIGSKTKRKNH